MYFTDLCYITFWALEYNFRWTITTKPVNVKNEDDLSNNTDGTKSSIISEAKNKLPLNVLNNYFSIGADAKIALDFHAARG